jgi:hypothetical protein
VIFLLRKASSKVLEFSARPSGGIRFQVNLFAGSVMAPVKPLSYVQGFRYGCCKFLGARRAAEVCSVVRDVC